MADVTIAADTRVIPWVDVSKRPEWTDSNIAAYRIWQRVSAFGWEQRHEWKRCDGSTYTEGWIRGATSWLSGATPAEGDAT